MGTLDGTAIGSITPSTGAFTTLSATTLSTSGAEITGGTLSDVAITGSSINSSTIGATTPAVGNFTEINVLTGSATINAGYQVNAAVVNTEYLTTGRNADTIDMATDPYLFYSNGGYSGEVGITSGNNIVVFADTAAGGSSEVQALSITHNFGGTGMTGPRNSLQVYGSMNEPSSNTSDAQRQYTAAQFTMFANSSDGGSAPTPGNSGGFVFAMDSQLIVSESAQNLSGAYAVEFDLDISAGATFQEAICHLLTTNLQATGNNGADSYLVMSKAATVSDGGYGTDFGILISGSVVKSTGSLFSVQSAVENGGSGQNAFFPGAIATYGIDFSQVNFSAESGAAFISSAFKISGDGHLESQSIVTGAQSGVATIDASKEMVTAVSIVSGGFGTEGYHCYYPSDIVYGPYNGQYQVTTTKVINAAVASGGSGGTSGTQTVTGTTGAGTKFQASVMVSGGAIESVLSITTPGSYTISPTSLTEEPVTGAGLTGAKLSLGMGIATVEILVPDYALTPPSNPVSLLRGSGGGATADFTWVAPSVLALNSTGGDVQIGSGEAIATSATTGFLKAPYTNGAPTGTPANSDGPAFVWNDTTKTLNIWSPSASAWYHIAASTGTG